MHDRENKNFFINKIIFLYDKKIKKQMSLFKITKRRDYFIIYLTKIYFIKKFYAKVEKVLQ